MEENTDSGFSFGHGQVMDVLDSNIIGFSDTFRKIYFTAQEATDKKCEIQLSKQEEMNMGFFRNSRGTAVGETSSSGLYGDMYGSYEGKVYDDGTIVNRYGRIEGSIDSDGNIYDRYGHKTDYTYGD